jgi:stage II sporulation protein AA (anti-sigma F factor antagonist)
MNIELTQEIARAPVTVMRMNGRINLSNAEEIQKAAQTAYAKGARNLLIDLAQVESITSAGLRAILATVKLFGGETTGGKQSPHVKLLQPNESVRQVLKIAGLVDFIEIYDDRARAIASF